MNVRLVRDTMGEWEGIYVDGVLKAEGHSLDSWQVLEALDIHGQEFIDMEAENMDRLPHEYKGLDGLDRHQ